MFRTMHSCAPGLRVILLSLLACPVFACGDDEASEEGSDEAETGMAEAGDPDLPPEASEGQAPPAGLRLMRSWEYENSLVALFGVAPSPSIKRRPDLVRANFTSVSAAQDCYDDIDIETYESLARDVVQQAFAAEPGPLVRFGCTENSIDDPCVDRFLETFIERAFRRPASEGELQSYRGLARSMTEIFAGDLSQGMQMTLATVVQSPNFIYRVELGTELPEHPGQRRFSSHEMAARLAYVLWGTPPDAELRAAAASGALETEAGVSAQAKRMLADERAAALVDRFWSEHLGIDRLNLNNYPRSGANAGMYRDMRKEVRALIRRSSAPGASAMGFLDADEAWLSSALADWYGAPSPSGGEGPVSLPEERRGFLTSGLFLASTGHPNKSSPTRRGKFVLERILCREVPPPPADVDLELPEVGPGVATQRDLLQQHVEDPRCAGCHQLIDPLGFAYEGFDQLGQHRQRDNGLPVDATGRFDGFDFDGGAELSQYLRTSAESRRCLATQAYRWALGHLEEEGQEPFIAGIATAFEASGEDFRALMLAIVTSKAFRFAEGFVGDDMAGSGGAQP